MAMMRSLLGGNGVVMEYGVARPFADMEALHTLDGTHEINMLITGREVLGISAIASPMAKRPKRTSVEGRERSKL